MLGALLGAGVENFLISRGRADEVARGVALVDTLEETDGVGPGRALELFCLMLLNTNEFAYLD